MLTDKQVEDRINELEKYNDDLKLILSNLGLKRSATMDEYQMFLEWTTNLEFNLDLKLIECSYQTQLVLLSVD